MPRESTRSNVYRRFASSPFASLILLLLLGRLHFVSFTPSSPIGTHVSKGQKIRDKPDSEAESSSLAPDQKVAKDGLQNFIEVTHPESALSAESIIETKDHSFNDAKEVAETLEQFPAASQYVDDLFKNSSLGCSKVLQEGHSTDGSRFLLFRNATNRIVTQCAVAPYLVRVDDIAERRPHMFYRLVDPDQRGVALFQNSFLHGAKSHIFNCDFEFFQGGCSYPKSKPNIMGTFTERTEVQEVEKAILSAQFWGYGFYHHLLEDFPRLTLLHNYILSNPDTKIFAYKPTPHLIAFYDILGIPQSQIIHYSTKIWYFVKRLFVPSASPCGRGVTSSLKYIQLRAKMRLPEMFPDDLADFEGQFEKKSKQIIVLQSRGYGKARCLTNHDLLLKSLQNEFASCCRVLVHTGSTPVAEAFLMHHKASLIIGPHGAGLSFSILAEANSSLIEIHPHRGNFGKDNYGINLCHQHTAEAVGLRTRLIHADNGGTSTPFTANVTKVIEAAKELLTR